MGSTSGATDGTVNPLDEQRELMDLLSQDTRHLIVQTILGHPEHLPSMDELDHLVADETGAGIRDHLERLREEGIVAEYTHEPNRTSRGLPWKFYGPTEFGVDVLGRFNYLDGVPMARAVVERTRTTETIARHRAAPRPSLPSAVVAALRLEDE